MDYPQIRKALLEVDDNKLSVDDLKAISKQLPTKDEASSRLSYVYSLTNYWATIG